MALSFDGGNILTFLLMMAVFYIYRYFDKNKRVTDLVRRTADDARNMLDNLVKERAENLQDLSRDIMARTDSCTNILQRIDDVYKVVNERKDEIELQMTHLDKHEDGLKQLNDLAARVDVNLQRLQEESRYVDEVGTRLNEMRRTLTKFEEKDEARFEKFQQKALETFKADLDKLNSSVSASNKQVILVQNTLTDINTQQDEASTARLASYGMEIEKLETGFRERLQKIAEEGGGLEDEAFTTLKDMLARREDKLLSLIEESNGKIGDANAQLQEELSNTAQRLDAANNRCSGIEEHIQIVYSKQEQSLQEVESRLKSAAEGAEKSIKIYESRMQTLSGELEASILSLNSRVQNEIIAIDKKMEGDLQSVSVSADEKLNSLDTHIQTEIAAISDKLDVAMHSGNTDIDHSLQKLNDRLQTETDAFSTDFEQRMQAVSSQMGDSLQTLSESIESGNLELDKKKKELNSKMDAMLLEARVAHDDMEDRIQNEYANIDKELEDIRKRVGALVEAKENSFFEDVESRQNEYKAAVGERFERIESLIGDMDGLVEGLEDRIQNENANIDKKLEDTRKHVGALVEAKENSFFEDVENRQNEYKAAVGERFERIESLIGNMDGLAEDLKDRIQNENANIDKELENIRKRVGALVEAKENSFFEDVENRQNEYKAAVGERFERIESLIGDMDGLAEGLKDRIQNENANIDKELEDIRKRVGALVEAKENSFFKDVESRQNEYKAAVGERFKRIENLIDDMDGLAENLKDRIRNENANIDKELEDIRKRVGALVEAKENNFFEDVENRQNEYKAAVGERFKRIENLIDDMDGLAENLKDRIQNENANIDKELEDIRKRVGALVEAKENSFFEDVEDRQNEYKAAVGERFERIENLIGNMDGLVDSLQLSQAQTLNEIEKGFKSFEDNMKTKREQEETVYMEALSQIRREITALEQEMEELKTSSYENTSQKLQVFEEEFFSDLKKRTEQMQTSVGEWKGKIESELTEIGKHAVKSRKDMEEQQSVKLKEEIEGMQEQVSGQLEIIQNQMTTFNKYMKNKVNELDTMISSFSNELPGRIQKEKDNSMAWFNKTFKTFNTEIQTELTNGKKDISRKINLISHEVNDNRDVLLATLQQVQDDTSEKIEQINTKMSEVERNTESVIKTVRLDFEIKTSELKDEYTGHTEKLILESEEERARLHRDIEEVRDSVGNISMEISEKSRVSLNRISDQSETYLLEFQKASMEIREEMDRKTKDLRQLIQDSNRSAEDLRKEMVEQIGHEHGRLKNNLDEIDRKQKQFIAETRIFDRTDELKETLASDIDELDKRIKAVGLSRDEIARIEQQYNNSMETYRELTEKMAGILADKQKVDNLGDKLTRIGKLSESVDVKLSRINEADKLIQDVQIRSVQLEDVNKALGEKFKHLYDQSTVMEKVSAKVDSSVQLMIDIDTKSKDLSGRIDSMSKELADYNERQIQLESNRDKIDEIVAKAASLDESIAELNARLELLQDARKWLAETETRLKELNYNTQQQLKLLGRVTRSEGLSGKKNVNDNLDDREMILGLAQNGWNSDAIAHSMKKSISEINLVLELESIRGER